MSENQDKHLQAPQEANTEKHINFSNLDEPDTATENTELAKRQLDESPTKKAWEELRDDNKEKEKHS